MTETDEFISISNAIVRNSNISPVAKMNYALLLSSKRNNLNINFNTLCVSISSLIHMTKYKYHASNIKIFRNSIIELVQIGAISIYRDMKLNDEMDVESLKAGDMFYVKFHTEYVYSDSFVYQFENGYDVDYADEGVHIFTSIYLDDLIEILDCDTSGVTINGKKTSVNKAMLFSVYAMILSRANIDLKNTGKSSKVSLDDIECISKHTGASASSVRRCIILLYSMRLIFKITVSRKNQLKTINVYSRWRDRNFAMIALDSKRSAFRIDYYRLMQIGDTNIDEEKSNRIINKIINSSIGEITCDWVDREILDKFVLS